MPRIAGLYDDDDVERIYQESLRATSQSGPAAILAAGKMTANALLEVAEALYRLGNADAASPMGGLEALGKAILEAHGK